MANAMKEWEDLPIEQWPEGSFGFVRDINGAKIKGQSLEDVRADEEAERKRKGQK